MPEMPDVAPSEIVASEWGNDIRDRTVQRYTSGADRDAKNPTPQDGDVSYVPTGSFNKLAIWHEGVWEDIVTAADGAILGGGFIVRRAATVSMGVRSLADAIMDFRQEDGSTVNRWAFIREQSSGMLRLYANSVSANIIEWTIDGIMTVPGTLYGGKVLNLIGTSFGQFWHRNIWINRSPSTPTGIITGDLWFDSSTNTISGWTGSAWSVIIDGNA